MGIINSIRVLQNQKELRSWKKYTNSMKLHSLLWLPLPPPTTKRSHHDTLSTVWTKSNLSTVLLALMLSLVESVRKLVTVSPTDLSRCVKTSRTPSIVTTAVTTTTTPSTVAQTQTQTSAPTASHVTDVMLMTSTSRPTSRIWPLSALKMPATSLTVRLSSAATCPMTTTLMASTTVTVSTKAL